MSLLLLIRSSTLPLPVPAPGDVTIKIGGSALLAGQLPEPIRLAGEVIPGTVNLVLNPDLESAVVGVDGWAGVGVTVTWDSGSFYEGAASAEAAYSAGAGDRSVTISTVSGLFWTNELAFVLGSLYVLGAFEGLQLALSAQYTDASIETGEPVDVDFSDPNAWTRPTCSLQLNPAKIVNTFFLILERASTENGGTLHLDGAQVERDAGWGVTPLASGRLGLPFHYWVGQDHRSASVRDDIPAEMRTFGRFGEFRLSWHMYRADASFRLLEDISEHVISASVTADRSRSLAWTMTCRLTQAGWARLRPWDDWLVPVLVRTDDQGETRTGFLGHYVVLPSPVTHFEHTAEYDVDCRSGEYLLSRQAFKGKFVVGRNANLAAVAKWIVDGATLGTSQIRPRVQIVIPNHRAEERYEFSRENSKLDIVNTLLEAAAMQPLWTSRSGIFRSFRVDTDRYRELQPVKLWAANFDPATQAAEAFTRRLARQVPAESNVVSGTIRRIPKLGDGENEIVVYTVDPRRPRVKAKYEISDPTNPTSVFWTGRWKSKKFPFRAVPTNAAARLIAKAIAEEVGTRIDQVEFSVIPDPEPDLLDQIVYLAIYRIDGTPVAVGRFRVLKIEYKFSAQNALMDLTLGFVHGVKEFQGGVPVRYFDQRNQTWFEDTGQPIELVL